MIEHAPQEISVRIQDQTKSFVLCPEAREDAAKIGAKVWAESMRLLHSQDKDNFRTEGGSRENPFILYFFSRDYIEKSSLAGSGAELKVTKVSDGVDSQGPFLLRQDFIFYPSCVVRRTQQAWRLPARVVSEEHEADREELGDLLQNIKDSGKAEAVGKPIDTGKFIITFLSNEAREDARKTAKKVWAKGIEFLKGGKHRMRNITDPDWEIIAVEGEKAAKEKDFLEGQEVDLIVTRSFSGISRGIKTIETYCFCKDNGGYVVKEIEEYLPRGLVRQRHEPAKEELENLLATMEKVK